MKARTRARKPNQTRRNVTVAPMPKTRDPFCNTPPVSLGVDAKARERFWIPSHNGNVGATGVLFDETGDYSLFRPGDGGAKSLTFIAREDSNTIWVSGDRSEPVLRLNLRSGKLSSVKVEGLMVLDVQTGRALCSRQALDGIKKRCFVRTVEIKTGRVIREHDKPVAGLRKKTAWINTDGTWNVVTGVPGCSVYHWNPKTGAVREHLKSRIKGNGPGFLGSPVLDSRNRAYFRGLGWYDPRNGRIDRKGPRPKIQCTWFKRVGDSVWGEQMQGDNTRVLRWDLGTGDTHEVCVVRDCHPCCVTVSESEKVIAMNHFGTFTRHDAHTGDLECSRVLPVEAVGQMDCVIRLDKRRILGTPFISQRFWELDPVTGEGWDRGRAAPGVGEILTTDRIGGKLYMAAYTGAELMEYDWRKPARYPENPRPVAKAPRGMRPVSSVNDGRVLWYVCNHPYGSLGSVLTRYDTRTGEASYCDEPLPGMQMLSLQFVKKTRTLYCGTCVYSDGSSHEPEKTNAVFAELDADKMKVRRRVKAPGGCIRCYLAGSLGRGRYLAVMDFPDGRRRWAPFDAGVMKPVDEKFLAEIPSTSPPIYAGRAGMFVYVHEGRAELWDMRSRKPVKVIYRAPRNWPRSYKCVVRDGEMILLFPMKAVIVSRIFASFGSGAGCSRHHERHQ